MSATLKMMIPARLLRRPCAGFAELTVIAVLPRFAGAALGCRATGANALRGVVGGAGTSTCDTVVVPLLFVAGSVSIVSVGSLGAVTGAGTLYNVLLPAPIDKSSAISRASAYR